MEVIFGVATLLGGFTAVWFLLDKARSIPWERVRFRRQDKKGHLPHEGSHGWQGFPLGMVEAVTRQFPQYRLPAPDDLQHDWAENYNSETMFPVACKGDFTGSGLDSWAAFLIAREQPRYKVVVLVGRKLVELTGGDGLPRNLFLRTIPAGVYLPGESTRVSRTPKVRRLRLRGDGINFGTFESADSIFYWSPRTDTFDQVWMSD